MVEDIEALYRVGAWLRQQNYRFVTVTPATHARVNARPHAGEARSLKDIFGWSRPFRSALLPDEVVQWLQQGGAIGHLGEFLVSRVRFSSLDNGIYLHSA